MEKELWRERWLNSINELTSLNLQKKSWLNTQNNNPHWSFIEFMCCYFDDTLCYDYDHYIDDGWVTEQEYEIIKYWHEILHKYEPPNKDVYNLEAILNDIKWLNILQEGLKAKNKLSEILTSDERLCLTKEIDYLKYM